MARPPEMDAAMTADALLPRATSWNTSIERAGQSPNILVTVSNSNGFQQRILVAESDGPTNEEIFVEFHRGTIEEVGRRRTALGVRS